MSARNTRINTDINKINKLSKELGNKITIIRTSGNPISLIEIRLDYSTVPSNLFPAKKQKFTDVKIELLSRYPFIEPKAVISTPIFHPNVFTGGKICFGTKWLPTENLDLLIKRIIKIITFDPEILNEKSPANRRALDWYKKVKLQQPNLFPTDQYYVNESERKITWKNI